MNRNCNHSFGVVSVSVETDNVASAAFSVTAVTGKSGFGRSLMGYKKSSKSRTRWLSVPVHAISWNIRLRNSLFVPVLQMPLLALHPIHAAD